MKVIKPGDPEYKTIQTAKSRMVHRIAQAKDKATAAQWEMVDFAVKAWIRTFPGHWMAFQQDLNRGRNEYNEAKEGDLKKARWRNTAAFPIAYVPDPVTGELKANSLLPILQKIIPHLTHKNSANYSEFLKRYPSFKPSQKSNASNFNRM